jgi:hypothetical protein
MTDVPGQYTTGAKLTRPKHRWTLGAVVLLLAGAMWVALLRRPQQQLARATVDDRPAHAGERKQEPGSRAQARSTAIPTPDRAPVDSIEIERVELSKHEVCRGEETVVTVHAESKDKEDEYLSYGVLGRPELVGPRFPLLLDESLGYNWMRVFVQGKFGTSKVVSVPPVLVKNCDAPLKVAIDVARKVDLPDRAWLTARVSAPTGGAQFEAIEYEWDFGDGKTEKTTLPEVEHSYEARQQTRAYSYFFVTLKVRDAHGRLASGSKSVRFVNLGFVPLTKDQVVVFSGTTKAASDTDAEKTWLYHGAPYPSELGPVTVKDIVVGADGAERVTDTRVFDALALLGFSHVPPGQSLVTRDLTHLRPSKPGATRVFELSGKARGIKTVAGSFNLIPPPAEVAQSGNESL